MLKSIIDFNVQVLVVLMIFVRPNYESRDIPVFELLKSNKNKHYW